MTAELRDGNNWSLHKRLAELVRRMLMKVAHIRQMAIVAAAE